VAPYEELNFTTERVLDAGGDEVLVLGIQRGRLRGSESWVEFRYGLINTVEGGKITRIHAYSTQKEALEAAGLSE
jgi:ketosteroid isomerase-like protein